MITKKPHTFGVMQVYSDKPLTDKESVIAGIEKVNTAYLKCLNKVKRKEKYLQEDWYIIGEIVNDYNTGIRYRGEINDLADTIKNIFYSDMKLKLYPTKI